MTARFQGIASLPRDSYNETGESEEGRGGKTDMSGFAVLMFVLAGAVLCPSAAAGDADAAATLPNSLENAKAGQWVLYRINTLFGMADQKQTLVAVDGEGDDRVLIIKSEMSIDGELVDERTDSITYSQAVEEQETALAEAENLRIGRASIDFRGTPLDAVRVDFVQDGNACVLYLSEKVPLVGMICMTVEGQDGPSMELLDFGE